MKSLSRYLDSANLSCERLYRIEMEKENPVGCASWERVALLYDIHDRSIEDLAREIDDVLDNQGRWRVTIYYWSGHLQKIEPRRMMGKGENFLYSPNPQGDLVLRFEPSLEIDFGESDNG